MTEYSVGEVRDVANDMQATELPVIRAAKGKAIQMLTAYADLREQIERAREGVTDEMVAAYVSAVNEHLGNMTEAEWQADRLDKHAHLARVARIGLTAVVHLLPSERGGVEADAADRLAKHLKSKAGYSCLHDDARRAVAREFLAVAHQPAQAAQASPRCWDAHGNPCCESPIAEPVAHVVCPNCKVSHITTRGYCHNCNFHADTAPPSTPNTTGAIGENGNG
jgi:hypothetical protein